MNTIQQKEKRELKTVKSVSVLPNPNLKQKNSILAKTNSQSKDTKIVSEARKSVPPTTRINKDLQLNSDMHATEKTLKEVEMTQKRINEESDPIKIKQSVESKKPSSPKEEEDIEDDAYISEDNKQEEPQLEEKK